MVGSLEFNIFKNQNMLFSKRKVAEENQLGSSYKTDSLVKAQI